MSIDQELEREIVSCLRHAGREIWERAVAEVIAELQNQGLIQERNADSSAPLKLTAAGAEAAKQH